MSFIIKALAGLVVFTAIMGAQLGSAVALAVSTGFSWKAGLAGGVGYGVANIILRFAIKLFNEEF